MKSLTYAANQLNRVNSIRAPRRPLYFAAVFGGVVVAEDVSVKLLKCKGLSVTIKGIYK